jgi:hypothetical protein
MHRYIPVWQKNAGFGKIGEKVVQHQARKYGETKFGMERFINGFLDLITIWFLSRFKRPFIIWCNGIANVHHWFLLRAILAFQNYHMFMNMRYSLVTNNLGFIALTTMVIGTQLFLAGFLGEIILRTKATKNVIKFQVRLIYNMPLALIVKSFYAGVQHKRL